MTSNLFDMHYDKEQPINSVYGRGGIWVFCLGPIFFLHISWNSKYFWGYDATPLPKSSSMMHVYCKEQILQGSQLTPANPLPPKKERKISKN